MNDRYEMLTTDVSDAQPDISVTTGAVAAHHPVRSFCQAMEPAMLVDRVYFSRAKAQANGMKPSPSRGKKIRPPRHFSCDLQERREVTNASPPSGARITSGKRGSASGR